MGGKLGCSNACGTGCGTGLVLPGQTTICESLGFATAKDDGSESGSEEDEDTQDHLLYFIDDLVEVERDMLQEQYESLIDEKEIYFAYHEAMDNLDREDTMHNTAPPHMLSWTLKKPPTLNGGANVSTAMDTWAWRLNFWRREGLRLHSQRRIGIVLLCGSEELEMDLGCPKCMVDMGLLSKKPLIQIHCERIKRLENICDASEKARLAKIQAKQNKEAEEDGESSESESEVEDHAERRKAQNESSTDEEEILAREEAKIDQKFDEELLKKAQAHQKAPGIPLYIMTNSENRDMLQEFFDIHKYFGLSESDVTFFTQDNFPIVDHKGKVLLKTKREIAVAPNGNGGFFKAAADQAIISDMKCRNLEWVHVMNDGNLLAKAGDPMLIGHTVQCNTKVGVKLIDKLFADEELGVFCNSFEENRRDMDGDGVIEIHENYFDTKAHIVEYFEMTKESRTAPGPSGYGLKFNCGNLSQYALRLDALSNAGLKKKHRPQRYHAYSIQMPHVSIKTGDIVHPENDNAYRLELFIFDIFDHEKKVAGLKVDRAEEMGPIKSIVGKFSPVTAIYAMSKLHQKWIKMSGGVFEEGLIAGAKATEMVEISPLVSYEGENLLGYFNDMHIDLPYFLQSFEEQRKNAEDSPRGDHEMHEVAAMKALEKDSLCMRAVRRANNKIRAKSGQYTHAELQVRDEITAGVVAVAFEVKAAQDAVTSERLCHTPPWLKKQEDHWEDEVKNAEEAYLKSKEADRLEQAEGLAQQLQITIEEALKRIDQEKLLRRRKSKKGEGEGDGNDARQHTASASLGLDGGNRRGMLGFGWPRDSKFSQFRTKHVEMDASVGGKRTKTWTISKEKSATKAAKKQSIQAQALMANDRARSKSKEKDPYLGEQNQFKSLLEDFRMGNG